MKLQDLNRSFAKVLAAIAIAFMISAAPAQAQGRSGVRITVTTQYRMAGGASGVCSWQLGELSFITISRPKRYRRLYKQRIFPRSKWPLLIYTAAGWMDAKLMLHR